jgi:pyrimidine operon attenuation protein/uracil phosphoribosyltransferase
LVDDVISTGRTARSALEAIIDKKIGRPRKIKFVVIINVTNARELPINPDFFIKKIDFRENKLIKVRLKEIDDIDEVVEYSATDSSA